MEGLVWMTNLLLLVSLFLYPVQSSGDSDRLCLLGFKGAIIFDPNNSLSNWVPTVSLCKWRGVTCSPLLQRVVAVNLSGMSLEGAISPLIGNLSALESLSLSRNALHGRIPSEIGRLSNVKTLNLERNQLEGNIPASLSGCRSLVLLALTYNRLQGTIPAELGSLPVLEILYLGGNFLTGKIPSSLGNISALTELELAANNLIGPIPAEIGMLTHLQRLTVFTNNLSGTIPSSIGNLSGLTYLHLSTNNFTDPIPSELGRLKKLNTLYIWENRLTGPIPTSLQNCTALVDLALYQNWQSGHIPKDLGAKLTKLRSIYLWGNELSGSIPKSIGNCSKLAHLNLYMNHLSGTVPIEFGKLLFLQRFIISFNDLVSENSSSLAFLTALTNCSYLEWIEVSFNHLTGVISPNFGYLSSKLSVLLLDNNKISGIIPQEITNLTNLTRLDLSNNLLSGSIPAGINRFSRIERLDLGGNGLEGSVPVEIGQLRSLGCLCLSQNKLTGKIPNSLGELQQLRRIFLHHNHFSGEIPASLQRCPNLELLDLSHNDLRGNIPGEVLTSLKNVQFYLNLSWNFFQGPLPKEISRVVSARAIDISGNLLEGEIPGVLANCIALEYLNLSRNALAGTIPDALGKLPNLQQIDLSSNFLSGAIPTSLTKMNALHYINFSFNNLTGSVQEGMIPNSTVVALLMGNPGLCGPKQYLLPACPRQRQGKHWLLTIIMVSLTGVIAFMLCSLLICVVCKKKVSDQQIDLSNIIFGRMGYPKFSYRDLVIATNGFNETNFLGNGSFGSVYKGILRDGKAVAIKVLNVHNEEGEKSFQSECKILGRIRHRNLIRILSACVHPDFRGLILHFASNGSLEKHLYSDNSELDLSKCLNIAIDVAHGMEYLHHDCFDQVVHCDLKPSNVLLDADMTALVADFGICKLTNFTNSMDSLHTTFSLRGSIGYIAPEYGLGGRVSPKGDVYSFGVLVLEMVTRKRPADSMFFEDLNLPKWVMLAFPNRLVDIVDNRLLSNVHMEQIKHLLSFVNVGLLCTKESPQERPTMRDVVRVLEGIRTAFIRCGATPSNSETGTRELVHNLKASATVEMVSESQS